LGSPEFEVVVAVYGDPSKPILEGLQDEPDKPYRERLKVSVQATRETSLADVLATAYNTVGPMPPTGGSTEDAWSDSFVPYWVAFYEPADEERFTSRLYEAIPLLDEQGRVKFGAHEFDEITFGELLDAAESGTLDGDPLRPYLILVVPQGGALSATWAALVNLWGLSWYVLEHIAAAGEAAYVVKRLRDRIKGGRDVVVARGEQWWMEQGADPDDVYDFLARVPRTTEQVAGLLGCSNEEAASALWAFGLAPDPESGLWYPGGDEEAKLLRGNTELIIQGANLYELADEFRERTEELLETGEAPDVEWPAQFPLGEGEGPEQP
jgi:hypothetical protein